MFAEQDKSDHFSLHFMGHNCYLVDGLETFLLIDPWLSNKGAFFGSWFQYPKNHHLRDEIVNLSVKKKGFVYFSHEHQDHFDLDTLCLLSPNTTIIIPSYRDKFLFKIIKENGFECIELEENKIKFLGESIIVKIFINEVGVNRDSAILVKTNNFVFFNQNDCKIFDRLNEIDEKITYYSVQFSGATWHPACYSNYSAEERIEISQQKNKSKLANVVKAIKSLRPEYFVPAAGPAIFPYLDPQLSYGRDNIFIHQDTLSKALESNDIKNVLFPVPGDIVDKTLIGKKFVLPPTATELESYRENTINFWDLYTSEFSRHDLERVVNERLDQIWDLDFQCDTLLQFRWGESATEQFIIDLEAKRIINEFSVDFDKKYILSADKKYFSLMCSNYRWQDIYLSLRARPCREPDEFNNYINLFLFSDVDNIRDGFMSTLGIPDERVLVKGWDGAVYEINRFCPHQGADLSAAEVNEKQELLCPRHGWRFSLDKSGDVEHGAYSICSKKIM
jgi:UDP-MurNAc hydroxylase